MFEQTHHIIPKSCGGDDSKENLVDCTIEEHALFHLELAIKYLNEGNFEYYSKNIKSACFIAFGQGKKYIDKMFEVYGIDAGNDMTNEIVEIQERIREQMNKVPPYKNKATFEFHKYLEEISNCL